jgi:hypothetical protein
MYRLLDVKYIFMSSFFFIEKKMNFETLKLQYLLAYIYSNDKY